MLDWEVSLLDAINGQLSKHSSHFITQERAIIDSTNNGIFSLPLCLCLAAILVRLLNEGKKSKILYESLRMVYRQRQNV